MNEKGFATIFGLCLILITALMVKGIQEAEMNHSYEMTDFQIEFDLQNAADSGIYMAAEEVHKNPLTLNMEYDQSNTTRKKYQFNVIHKTIGSIQVDVWAERLILKPYEVVYGDKNDAENGKATAYWVDDGKNDNDRKVYTFFSKAEVTGKRISGKLYRRSFAYVEIDGEGNSKTTIYFMDIASRNITYKEKKKP